MSSNLFLDRREINTLNVTICTHLLTLWILYNKRDATYTMFFIIISAVHVSGGFSAHHQKLIKLCVQPWVMSCFPVFYRWCGWVGTVHTSGRQQESMTIPKAAHTVYKLLMMGGKTARNM